MRQAGGGDDEGLQGAEVGNDQVEGVDVLQVGGEDAPAGEVEDGAR
jgi:hypothetical protein